MYFKMSLNGVMMQAMHEESVRCNLNSTYTAFQY